MKIFYTDRYVLPLPDGHTFPMEKYRLLRERVDASGLVRDDEKVVPHAVGLRELLLAHDADYALAAIKGGLTDSEMRRIGFPWSAWLIERSRRSAGATTEGCFAAIEDGFAVNLAGGTHHAFRDHGEGYCVFNDSVVAARCVQRAGKIQRIAVIDCDVHQGNGTAAICRLNPSIFTFSIHGARNYPTRKEIGDLDIELADGTGDREYLDRLEVGVRQTMERSRAQLAIYLAGADPFEGDRLGRMKLTREGLSERDRVVFEACAAYGVPLVVTMAGGYARDIADIVDIHWQTVRRAIAAHRGR